jgi:putative hemolysin
LVIGELVPKRLALQRPEALSLASAPTIDRIASIFRPLIWLLSIFTNLIVRALGGNPNEKRAAITEEELQGMLLTHTGLSREERKIVSDVFTAGDTRLREVMVPRTEVNFLVADTFVAKALADIVELPHSRYPVLGDGVDDVVGFVHVRDLLNPAHAGTRLRVEDLVREIMQLPGSKNLLPALTQMRNEGAHMAVVVDEYGGTAGIVTLEDLVEELVGDIRDEYDSSAADTRTLAGGDVEVDGLLNIDDFMRDASMTLPDGPYETVAGFMVATLGRLPHIGDVVEEQGRRLEVSAMDGRRVARIRVAAAPVDNSISDNNDHA